MTINALLLYLFSDKFKDDAKIILTKPQVKLLKQYIVEINRQRLNKTMIRIK